MMKKLIPLLIILISVTASARTINDQGMGRGAMDRRYTSRNLVNGSFQQSFNALVSADAVDSHVSLFRAGGGDLTMQFSDGNFILDTTPTITIDITEGSDASPQGNYVYVSSETKELSCDTTSFPTDLEHIKVVYVLAPSASYMSVDGAYINQNWNDHLQGTDSMGHMLHMAERSRRDGAYWFSGVGPNGDAGTYIKADGAARYFESTAGIIYQMHRHVVPLVDTDPGAGNDDIHVVNERVSGSGGNDPYWKIQDLTDITADADGDTLTNKYFNLVFWGVGNKTGEYAPIMVNLPTGSYNHQADAESDGNGYDVLTIPREFSLESSTGFLIARITFKNTAGTWSTISTVDLRGQTPATATGGATGAITSFPDNTFDIFDEGDVTKLLNFDVGTLVGSGNTSIVQIPDEDGIMAYRNTNNNFSVDQTFDTQIGIGTAPSYPLHATKTVTDNDGDTAMFTAMVRTGSTSQAAAQTAIVGASGSVNDGSTYTYTGAGTAAPIQHGFAGNVIRTGGFVVDGGGTLSWDAIGVKGSAIVLASETETSGTINVRAIGGYFSTTDFGGTLHDAIGVYAKATPGDGANQYDLYLDGSNTIKTGTGTLGLGSDNLTTTGTATVNTLAINATADHTITDSSDDLVITNSNASKKIIFNNDGIAPAVSISTLDLTPSNPGIFVVPYLEFGSAGLGAINRTLYVQGSGGNSSILLAPSDYDASTNKNIGSLLWNTTVDNLVISTVGATSHLDINPGGDTIIQSNLSVGTSSNPTVALDVVGAITATGNITIDSDSPVLGTDSYISVGAGDDTRIYHDGTATYISSDSASVRVNMGTNPATGGSFVIYKGDTPDYTSVPPSRKDPLVVHAKSSGGSIRGMYVIAESTIEGFPPPGNTIQGLNAFAVMSGSGNIPNGIVGGLYGASVTGSGGTQTSLYGVQGQVAFVPTGYTNITNAAAIATSTANHITDYHNVTNLSGLLINNISSTKGRIANTYGVKIGNLTPISGDVAVAIDIGTVSGATANYAIRNTGNADSDFGSGAIATTGTISCDTLSVDAVYFYEQTVSPDVSNGVGTLYLHNDNTFRFYDGVVWGEITPN